MNGEYSFCIRFSSLKVRFVLPTQAHLPECFTELLCEDNCTPDVTYRVSLIKKPITLNSTPIYEDGDIFVWETTDGYLRIYKPLIEEDGCQVACLLRKNGENIMYYPEARWHSKYRNYLHCTHLICGERMLLHQDALLLHSSVVLKDGKAVLFCGASGAGKSTQAKLWQEHLGAEVINGDRCVIMRRGSTFLGGGSPFAGTSGIYSPKQAPIAGIFILNKADENKVSKAFRGGFHTLYSQTTVNAWDKNFVDFVSNFYTSLLDTVPVFELSCRADKDAAMLAYNTLFEKEASL